MMDKHSKIYVAGHRGMVGSALLRTLHSEGYDNLLLRTHTELDLTSQQAVVEFFESERPDYVFLAAAKVGGILANESQPAQFLYENLMIQNNVLHTSYLTGVRKLMLLGSSCIYPKYAAQPIVEEALLTGSLEPTNAAYAIAKIAGIKMCDYYRKQYGCDFVSVMPTNLYGSADNYDLKSSHVLPAMIRKFHEAKLHGTTVELWGSGTPYREFLHADDMASATLFCMNRYSDYGQINVGSQMELQISELAEMVSDIVGYKGEVKWERGKPDGTPRKLMDSTRLYAMGWRPTIPLRVGIERTYEEFKRGL
ncbi:MAG: GDP-L-fucose synthase [Rikenellaceae bacterium]